MTLCRWPNGLARRVARSLDRPTVTVTGRWGRITGHTDDAYMLGFYSRHGTWSRAVVELATARIAARPRQPWHLADIGAGIGLVTIGVLAQARPTVDLFEPDPENFSLLRANLARHKSGDDLRLHFCALGDPADDRQTVVMRRTPGNGGDSRMRRVREGVGTTPLRRLDDMLAPRPDAGLIVKIDVQGAEPEVLAGGAATLARADLLVVEFWPHGLRAMGHDPAALADRLLTWPGRAALLFDEHRPQPIVWTTPERLRERLVELAAQNEPDCQAEVLLARNPPA